MFCILGVLIELQKVIKAELKKRNPRGSLYLEDLILLDVFFRLQVDGPITRGLVTGSAYMYKLQGGFIGSSLRWYVQKVTLV